MKPLDKDIRAKRAELSGLYGELVSLQTACKILGYRDRKTAKQALNDLGVLPVPINGRVRYETGEIAKRIVLRRGMVDDLAY